MYKNVDSHYRKAKTESFSEDVRLREVILDHIFRDIR